MLHMNINGDLPPWKEISILSGLFILASVTWEELWFRGIALELGGERYSKTGAAIIFGAVFALLHILNPQIDLLKDGLQLFVAGYTLSICYFVFDSLWAVIGMHFANNLAQAMFGMPREPRSLFFLIPLGVIALALTMILRWRRQKFQTQ